MTQLLIATNNNDKIEELQDLLKDLSVQLVTPADIDLQLEVVEDGLTYAENAAKKAIAFSQASGLISLADDSGLEVDALDGAPGLYSARYGSMEGKKLTYAERRKFLIRNLQNYRRPWTARFKATIAIAIPSSVTVSRRSGSSADRTPFQDRPTTRGLSQHQAETLRSLRDLGVTSDLGSCEGEIIPEERGMGGFGYDPIFLFPELGKTMAELSMEEKNRLSHRAKAVMKAKETLKLLLAG